MFSGINDTTVRQAVMNTLQQYHETYSCSSNIAYNQSMQANCGIDAEQTFLTNFDRSLNAKNTGTRPTQTSLRPNSRSKSAPLNWG
jgi:hypothetical protein